jgi:hypothetical protein
VSNSSTASFLVRYKDWLSKGEPLLDEEACKKLEKYGFKKSYAAYPSQIDLKEVPEDDFYSYAYEVICNEMDDLEWLIENNIPFVADCHYDQYTVIYKKDSDHVLVLKNMGIYYQMHYNWNRKDTIEEKVEEKIPEVKAIEKIPKGLFLKEGYQI